MKTAAPADPNLHDRRSTRRYPVWVDADVAFGGGGEPISGRLYDIGEGSALLGLPEAPPSSGRMDLTFEIDGERCTATADPVAIEEAWDSVLVRSKLKPHRESRAAWLRIMRRLDARFHAGQHRLATEGHEIYFPELTQGTYL
jgi:hypothetical protein